MKKPDKYAKFLRALGEHKGEFQIERNGCIRHKQKEVGDVPVCPLEVISPRIFSSARVRALFSKRFGKDTLGGIMSAADNCFGHKLLRRRMLRAIGLKEKKRVTDA